MSRLNNFQTGDGHDSSSHCFSLMTYIWLHLFFKQPVIVPPPHSHTVAQNAIKCHKNVQESKIFWREKKTKIITGLSEKNKQWLYSIIFNAGYNQKMINKSKMQPPTTTKWLSYFVSVAWPQGDTRKANNPKETVNSLSADRIKIFEGKHTTTSTKRDT